MTEIKDQPNPGSDEAVDGGCLCPVTKYNKPHYTQGGGNVFWASAECPIHGSKGAEL